MVVVVVAVVLSIDLSVFLQVQKEAIPRDFLSSIFELDNVQNEAILRDFRQFSKLTTSKTKQFCDTTFRNGKLSAELTASYKCALRFSAPSV